MRRLGPTGAISTLLMTVIILTKRFSWRSASGWVIDHSLVVIRSALKIKMLVSASATLGGNDPCPPETMMDLGDGCLQAVARRHTRSEAQTIRILRMSLISLSTALTSCFDGKVAKWRTGPHNSTQVPWL